MAIFVGSKLYLPNLITMPNSVSPLNVPFFGSNLIMTGVFQFGFSSVVCAAYNLSGVYGIKKKIIIMIITSFNSFYRISNNYYIILFIIILFIIHYFINIIVIVNIPNQFMFFFLLLKQKSLVMSMNPFMSAPSAIRKIDNATFSGFLVRYQTQAFLPTDTGLKKQN